MGKSWSQRTILGLAFTAVAVVIVSSAALAVLLFTQTTPTVNAPVPGMAENCGTLDLIQVTDNGAPAAQANGTATFDCGSSAAFAVTTAGTYDVGVSLAQYSDAYAYPASDSPGPVCSAMTGEISLAGPSANLAVGSYDYCFDFGPVTAGSSLGPATVSWSTA